MLRQHVARGPSTACIARSAGAAVRYWQWLKWGEARGGGAQPPAPIWAPLQKYEPPDWIYKVLFYA